MRRALAMVVATVFVAPYATAAKATQPIFEVIDVRPEPCVTQGSPGTEGSEYGFEGGRALRHGGAYHVFTTEMWGRPIWTRTRLAHWRSDDA